MKTAASDFNVREFTPAPMRNRIEVELNAGLPEVWAVVGDPARLPEYSAGLEQVEVKAGPDGQPVEYTCRFRAEPGEAAQPLHRERIVWYERERGWASRAADPVAGSGVRDEVHVVQVHSAERRTRLSWSAYYEADDLERQRAHFDEALTDIGERLIARFGGWWPERPVEARGEADE